MLPSARSGPRPGRRANSSGDLDGDLAAELFGQARVTRPCRRPRACRESRGHESDRATKLARSLYGFYSGLHVGMHVKAARTLSGGGLARLVRRRRESWLSTRDPPAIPSLDRGLLAGLGPDVTAGNLERRLLQSERAPVLAGDDVVTSLLRACGLVNPINQVNSIRSSTGASGCPGLTRSCRRVGLRFLLAVAFASSGSSAESRPPQRLVER
jgi:hypothetical protein